MPRDTYEGATVADRIALAIVGQGSDPWQGRAACRDDAGLMDATVPPAVFDALTKCAGCPVIAQCDAWVRSEPDYVGVAAGLVFKSRRATERGVRPQAG